MGKIEELLEELIQFFTGSVSLSWTLLTRPRSLRTDSFNINPLVFYAVYLFLGSSLILAVLPHVQAITIKVSATVGSPDNDQLEQIAIPYQQLLSDTERIGVRPGILGNLVWLVPSVLLMHVLGSGLRLLFPASQQSTRRSYRAFFYYAGLSELLYGLAYVGLATCALVDSSKELLLNLVFIWSLLGTLAPIVCGYLFALAITVPRKPGIAVFGFMVSFVMAYIVLSTFHVLYIWVGTTLAAGLHQ